MPYTVTTTKLEGVLLLTPKVFGDTRGFFYESFNQREFALATGIDTQFVQDNHSHSSQGVLRGLHYQIQHPQGKLVRVTQGSVFDVVVDLRRTSPSFGQWEGFDLRAESHEQLWIPPGFAHGFLVTSKTADFLYKTTDYWHPEFERSLLWSDSTLNINWPLNSDLKLTQKDTDGVVLSQAEVFD